MTHRSIRHFRGLMALTLLSLASSGASAQFTRVPRGEDGLGASSRAHGQRLYTTETFQLGDEHIRASGSWSRLSDADRDTVRRAHADLLYPGGDPPYPIAGIGALMYTLSQIDSWPAEDVPLEIVVSDSGSAERVVVPERFEHFQVAIDDAFIHIGFRAARCNGRACEGRFRILVTRDNRREAHRYRQLP